MDVPGFSGAIKSQLALLEEQVLLLAQDVGDCRRLTPEEHDIIRSREAAIILRAGVRSLKESIREVTAIPIDQRRCLIIIRGKGIRVRMGTAPSDRVMGSKRPGQSHMSTPSVGSTRMGSNFEPRGTCSRPERKSRYERSSCKILLMVAIDSSGAPAPEIAGQPPGENPTEGWLGRRVAGY